ncbi:MAG TPA: NADH-quinone oxidoreductase subunit L, partial [Longimicrobiales bacterium]|nr:NADH-quinone oxidoreductase subunit L [Longimicrobiales bacterium]
MAYPYVSDREVRVISEHFGDPEARTLEGAKKRGRYETLKKALEMDPDEVTEVVKASGLRGRGGAGFPT